jgi:hypothetical protein
MSFDPYTCNTPFVAVCTSYPPYPTDHSKVMPNIDCEGELDRYIECLDLNAKNSLTSCCLKLGLSSTDKNLRSLRLLYALLSCSDNTPGHLENLLSMLAHTIEQAECFDGVGSCILDADAASQKQLSYAVYQSSFD